jgi:hypothetical protein
MTIIENDMPSPSVQANRLGLADTHSCGRLIVSHRETSPTGLACRPIVTRIRNSMKKKVVTACSGM